MESVLPCLSAFVATLVLTPLARNLAHRCHFLDHPEEHKVHKAPIPLLGGVAVFGGLLVALFIGVSQGSLALNGQLLGFVAGATVLVGLGLVDDRRGMSPKVKLAGQILAAAIVVSLGFRVSFIESEILSVAISLFWIVGLINAMNLLDNMDGMTGGVTFIASCAFFAIGVYSGNTAAALIAAALGGASLGYLKYNLPPATIFLGDAGSMLVGFVMATCGLMVSNGEHSITGMVAPLVVLAYPIFDTTLVTIIRLAEGRSVADGGKDHSTHRIFNLTQSTGKTVLWVYGINGFLTVSAVIIAVTGNSLYSIAFLGSVLVMLCFLGFRLNAVPVEIPAAPKTDSPSVLPTFPDPVKLRTSVPDRSAEVAVPTESVAS